MGSRKHISRKDISASAFTPKPKPNILQTRPFSNGKHARSSELPTTKDILQTRPFATPAQKSSTAEKQPPTPESQEKASAFGYNGASIPSFAPSEAAPIQAKLTLGEPGDKYEQEADTVAAQVVDEINTPQSQQTAVGETVQREEMEEEEIRQKPEIETIQREEMLEEGEETEISPKLESTTLQREEMPQEEEETEISPKLMVQAKSDEGEIDPSLDVESSIQGARGGGEPLAQSIREPMEGAFGADFSGVKVHTDGKSDELNQSIQARAFTTGQDIFFRSGTYDPGSRGGQELLAHELTHVVQQTSEIQTKEVPTQSTAQPKCSDCQREEAKALPSLASELTHLGQQSKDWISLRPATGIERQFWLSVYSHYLPKKLINNYMDDTGNSITLTQQEMIDCNPVVDIGSSDAFLKERDRLISTRGGTNSNLKVSGKGNANTNGTLGQFTINYSGKLTVQADGNWNFNGVMDFYDYWNFDPGVTGRTISGEIRTRIASHGLPGKPFHIYSVQVPMFQTTFDGKAQWAGGTPSSVPDNFRFILPGADADVGSGEVGGGVGVGKDAQRTGRDSGSENLSP